MTNVVFIDPENRFIGSWKSCDGFSDVTFHVSNMDGSFTISVDDPDSDSPPEVFGVLYQPAKRMLEFSVHWSHTGRCVKYRLIPSPSPGRVDVTFTYTATELWERKG
jgi:hypothetical protein